MDISQRLSYLKLIFFCFIISIQQHSAPLSTSSIKNVFQLSKFEIYVLLRIGLTQKHGPALVKRRDISVIWHKSLVKYVRGQYFPIYVWARKEIATSTEEQGSSSNLFFAEYFVHAKHIDIT